MEAARADIATILLDELQELRREVRELLPLRDDVAHLQRELEQTREQLERAHSDMQDHRQAPAGHPDLPPGLPNKPNYTYEEVADAAGVSYRTAQGWASAGRILTIDVGGPRVPRDELVRLLYNGVRRRGRRA